MEKNSFAFLNGLLSALSNPMVMGFKYLTWDKISIMFLRAGPSISEYKEGKIKSIGLFFEKTISSFSRSFADLFEMLWSVLTTPF